MKFRNLIFVLAIAFSAIFVSMLGTSYAYYVATGGTAIDVTTGNVDTGVAVIFEQSQYINVNTGVPINESDIDTLASSSVFKIKPDATVLADSDVVVNIGIVDIYMSNDLKVSDFKYKLSCTDSAGSTTGFEIGTGTNFTSTVISNDYLQLGSFSTTKGNFDINKEYTCTLRVWLQETNADQNALMNKKFRGLIKVNTLFKIREDVVYE